MEKYVLSRENMTRVSPAYLCRSLPECNSAYSLYSGDYGQGNYLITGRILVAIWYEENILYIHIIRAESLADAKEGRLSDPYVKTCLTPDSLGVTKRRTIGQTKTNNPVYNEIIKYDLPPRAIEMTKLFLSIWDRDMCGRNRFLGQVQFPLCSRDLTDTTEKWYELENRKNEPKPPFTGKIYLDTIYDTNIKSLLVKVKHCENLPEVNPSVHTGYFVRLLLLPDLSPPAKRKSTIVRTNSNPIWDQQFLYNIPMDELKNRVLEISLWSVDNDGLYNFIGCVRLGPKPNEDRYLYKEWMDSYCSEYFGWQDTLTHPNKWVETNHKLRTTMLSRFEPDGLNVDNLFYDSDGNKSAGGDFEVRGGYTISGALLLGLDYQDDILYCDVVKAMNLAAAKSNGLSDPFLKMQLLEGNCNHLKWKSIVKQNTLNPLFNNIFAFKVKDYDLPLFTLHFSAWDKGEEGQNNFLGQTKIKLSKSVASGSTQWFNFVENCETCNNEGAPDEGQLSLTLTFQVNECINGISHGDLVICINNANKLPTGKIQECRGSFVKLILKPHRVSESPETSRQSQVVKGSPNCIWDEKFEYEGVTLEQLSNECVLEVTVWEETSLHESIFIGGLRMGCTSDEDFKSPWNDSTYQEVEHWEEMLLNPNYSIERSHTLRPSMH